MENKKDLNSRYETIAWGALFVLWGLTGLFKSLPDGLDGIGIGLILLALNLARAMKGINVSTFTTILGFVALLVGSLDLARAFLGFTIDLPIFALTLLILGAVILGRQLIHHEKGTVE